MSRFTVVVRDDGSLRVTKSDGTPCYEHDRKWIAEAITYALKSEANTTANPQVGPGKTRQGGVPFEVDPMVVELEERRAKVGGLSKSRLAKLLGVSRPVVGDWVRGAARPHMEDFRNWAAQPGISMMPMLIPAALIEAVELLKKSHDSKQD